MRKIKICYFGTYRADYKHNRETISRLQEAGFEVVECNVPLWGEESYRIAIATGGWKKPRFWWRVLSTYGHLMKMYLKMRSHDVLFVGYPGHLDVFLARILCSLRGKPLVWDILMSWYLLAEERELRKTSNLILPLISLIEKYTCKLADRLIVDTMAYMQWYMQRYNLSPDKFWLIPFGANDKFFKPSARSRKSKTERFVVLYYGSYVPNHGTTIIVEAARLLQEQKRIVFKMIGDGPHLKACLEHADRHHLRNIEFLNWMDQNKLVDEIRSADICLGSFADTPHGRLTVQNKIYECLACAKPVITGDSPAIREFFTPDEHVKLIKREDAAELAKAILLLCHNPRLRKHLALSGYQHSLNKFTNKCIEDILKKYIYELLSSQ